jgi:hypothetical protein
MQPRVSKGGAFAFGPFAKRPSRQASVPLRSGWTRRPPAMKVRSPRRVASFGVRRLDAALTWRIGWLWREKKKRRQARALQNFRSGRTGCLPVPSELGGPSYTNVRLPIDFGRLGKLVALASLQMNKSISSAGSRCHFFLLLWSSPKARGHWHYSQTTPAHVRAQELKSIAGKGPTRFIPIRSNARLAQW